MFSLSHSMTAMTEYQTSLVEGVIGAAQLRQWTHQTPDLHIHRDVFALCPMDFLASFLSVTFRGMNFLSFFWSSVASLPHL